ncbi:hypothetical protein H1164_17085 [Thermoactinomyces daqus]|uniref:Uncharacterized protein n=1 Tax=Thermoactinomyces daqus TaxID=1329516 RepID=A0A7W2AJ85_9BACL|nr:hypothetical protein [Thermoactinomyces daqus]MBA4544546.1 hypothetical protein [Thermoactinomyces daqus]
MNLYILKHPDDKVYELAAGNTPEEAAKELEYFFGWNTKVDASELELFGQVEFERPIYWGYYDPRTGERVYPCPKLFKAAYGFPHPELARLEEPEPIELDCE